MVQVYTTRTNVAAAMQRFWRVRVASATWSAWKELADVSSVVSYAGSMPAGQDLNGYTQRGLWAVATSAIAAGGTNFPIGQSGYLLVMSAAQLGGVTVTSGVCQVYYAGNGNKVYNRSLITGTWSPWVASVDSAQLAAPGGIATLDNAGKVPQGQILSLIHISATFLRRLAGQRQPAPIAAGVGMGLAQPRPQAEALGPAPAAGGLELRGPAHLGALAGQRRQFEGIDQRPDPVGAPDRAALHLVA